MSRKVTSFCPLGCFGLPRSYLFHRSIHLTSIKAHDDIHHNIDDVIIHSWGGGGEGDIAQKKPVTHAHAKLALRCND